MKNFTWLIVSLMLISCKNVQNENTLVLNNINEIFKTERAFEKMAADSGLAKAFSFFADDSVVIDRGKGLIKGKAGVREFYSDPGMAKVVLKWKPDFVEVSSSGDLGYTYGRFTHVIADSTGKITERTGVFHTVWKRQKDGSWKYVWD
jgi:ketosteroid isomerase-like protein